MRVTPSLLKALFAPTKKHRPILAQHASALTVQAISTAGRSDTEWAVQRRPVHVDSRIAEAFGGDSFPGRDLLECLMSPALPLAGEEGMFDNVGSLFYKAIITSKPFVTNRSNEYFERSGHHIVSAFSRNTDSVKSIAASPAGVLNEETTRLLLKRAILADASLQALQTLTKHQLQRLQLRAELAEELQMPEDGVFDFLRTVSRTVGSLALSSANSALKNVAPIVLDVAKQMRA